MDSSSILSSMQREVEALNTLYDHDLFENPSVAPKFYTKRPTVKGIILNTEGKIAFLNSPKGYGLFPGGGVKKGESLEEALIRECMEETGCTVELLSYIGRFDQYRNLQAKKYEIYFFLCFAIDTEGVRTTQDEEEQVLALTWEDEGELYTLLEEQIAFLGEGLYSAEYNTRTHLLAFIEYYRIRHGKEVTEILEAIGEVEGEKNQP